jgi:hypothetical protein
VSVAAAALAAAGAVWVGFKRLTGP